MFKPSILATCIATVLLTACGGSSNDSTNPVTIPPPTTAPPTTTTTETTGVITGFGSVYVNGVEYETDTSSISTDDNAAANELDLEVGMIVTLSGEINDDGSTGTASAIHYEEQIKGPLDSIDLAANTLVVLGQTISFDDLTSLDNIVLADLAPGDFLEISGFLNATGELYATRIEKEDGVTQLKIQGIVSLLDTATQTFMIDNLTINYSTAEFDDFTLEDLANNQEVRVKGDSSALVDNIFTIAKIKLKNANDVHEEGDTRNIEGIVTNFVSASEFVVNGIVVITDENTEVEHGTLESVGLNIRVKIKGEYVNDTLLAKEIRIHQRTNLKLEGEIQALDIEEQTVTILDVTFTLSLQTKMEDESVTDVRFFDIADLSVGDFVEIKGFINVDGNNIATKLKRQNEDELSDTELKGEITDVVDYGFSIVGVAITTTETTMFEDNNGDKVSQAMFFTQALAGMLAEVKGSVIDGEFVANDVEIKVRKNDKDDDDANIPTHRTEFRGIVEEIVESGFIVSGHNVVLADNVEIEFNGVMIAIDNFWKILKIDDQIKIKGTINEAGDIIAKSIELEIEHQANVAKIAIWGSISYIDGVLSINGQNFDVDPNIVIESFGIELSLEDFLAQIQDLLNVKIEGVLRDGALFVADIEILESDRKAGKIKIKSLIEDVIASGFLIAGYDAIYDEATLFLIDDENVDVTQFNEQLSEQTKVEMEGMLVIETLDDGTATITIAISEISMDTDD